MEISNFKVTELTLEEQKDLNGGVFPWVPILLIVVEEIVSDWDNFKAGLAGKPER